MNKKNIQYDYLLDMPAPQATELEEVVLGACMIEQGALKRIEFLSEGAFYLNSHQMIFRAIKALSEGKVDILTVADKLRQQGALELAGGVSYITGLTLRIASTANLEYHAAIIQEKYLHREVIRISRDLQELAYDDTVDIFGTLDKLQNELAGITTKLPAAAPSEVGKELTSVFKQINGIQPNVGITGIETGFTELNKLLSGWQNGELIILGARPGMGKTSLLLQLLTTANKENPVLFNTLEMTKQQLIIRIMSMEGEVDNTRLKHNSLSVQEWERLMDNVGWLQESRFFLSESNNIDKFRSNCRRMKERHNIGLIAVDYIQLMESSLKNTNQDGIITDITKKLKLIAKELNVPVIAISSLNRGVETRVNKRPTLSDLRESGSIESNADVVAFLFRDDYYKEQDVPLDNEAEIEIAKNRNGATGYCKFNWIPNLTKFESQQVEFSEPAPFHNEPNNDTPF